MPLKMSIISLTQRALSVIKEEPEVMTTALSGRRLRKRRMMTRRRRRRRRRQQAGFTEVVFALESPDRLGHSGMPTGNIMHWRILPSGV